MYSELQTFINLFDIPMQADVIATVVSHMICGQTFLLSIKHIVDCVKLLSKIRISRNSSSNTTDQSVSFTVILRISIQRITIMMSVSRRLIMSGSVTLF